MAKEVHPDWKHHIPGMRTLILGTFPPIERRDYEFYYPNSQNWFWVVLAACRPSEKTLRHFEGPQAVSERKSLMEELLVGVENLGLEIERQGNSPLDKDIEITQYQDILSIVRSTPSLKTIHLTGYSGKTSAYGDFVKYLMDPKNKLPKPHLPSRVQPGESFSLPGYEHIQCRIGNSTSSTTGISPAKLVRQFRESLPR